MIDPLSPLDGRYREYVEELARFFSESSLIRTRIAVEVEWLIFLVNDLKLEGSHRLSQKELVALRKVYQNFQEEFAEEVKKIEKDTKHDVKAVEYFLQKVLKTLRREDLVPFLHFACTSEDINNLAYAQMLKGGVVMALRPTLEKLLQQFMEFSEKYKKLPMLAHTHGQPASPTTVGKEFKNVGARLYRQFEQVENFTYWGKMNGATGNFNAHMVAYPEVDWLQASRHFVESLGLSWQRYTTQIEPHDYMAELFDILRRLNTILIDFSRNCWAYISMGYFKQKIVKGEVGSSTMPHKVNPIDFENAEGNLGLANALFSHFSEKLPISRLQRDLTDSTVLRNVGSAFAHSLLAYKSLLKGFSKIEVDEKALKEDLNKNWGVLAEAIQTMLRRYSIPDAYEQLKELTRGETVTQESIAKFVKTLKIPDEAKKRLLKLSPEAYIGLADRL